MKDRHEFRVSSAGIGRKMARNSGKSFDFGRKRKRFLLFRAFSVYFLQKSEINQRGDIKLTTKYLRVKNDILTLSKRSYFQTHRTQVRNTPVLKGFH